LDAEDLQTNGGCAILGALVSPPYAHINTTPDTRSSPTARATDATFHGRTTNVTDARHAADGTADRVRPPRWSRRVAVSVALACLLGGLVSGFAAGYASGVGNLLERGRAALSRQVLFARAALGDDDQLIEWREIETALHTVEYATFRVAPDTGRGGALEEIDGRLVIATALGRLLYLDPSGRLVGLGATVPLHLDALRKSPLLDDPLFALSSFRVYDLMVRRTGPTSFELYASHSRFESERCFQFVVSRTSVSVSGGTLLVGSGAWSDVFVARPACLRPKDRGWKFLGIGAGGRMVLLDDRTLLVGVGDHQFDGFNDSWAAAQDPSTDLGKLIAVDLASGAARVHSVGARNPQGLLRTRDGRIFETEHGPQAGDEINVIREGVNYGWPIVTYGVNYGFPRRDWPFNPHPGAHDGYAKPAMAFVPAIGIGNLVQPDPAEFPMWRDDLLVASLRANTLFRVRAEGDHLVYAEPIAFQGHRLRDIVQLADGRVAMLSDGNEVLLVRNAARHGGASPSFVVTGLGALEPLPEEAQSGSTQPAQRGRELFQLGCASCHSLDGQVGVGPPLAGIVGRRVGSHPGFRYSPALAAYDGVWTEELLLAFMTDPQATFHGTTMPPLTLDWKDAPSIVAYLQGIRAP
jgi:aldose sugar dehydrogenase